MQALFGISIWKVLNYIGQVSKLIGMLVSLAFSMRNLVSGQVAYARY